MLCNKIKLNTLLTYLSFKEMNKADIINDLNIFLKNLF